jgi:hypothetical protein
MSLIFATQLTAVATAVLAVFAIVTAVFALLAFRKQSREVGAIEKQVTDQETLTKQQAELLEIQGRQLDLQQKQFDQQAGERRRAQASRVFMWTEFGVYPRATKAQRASGDGQLEAVTVHIKNTSEQPVYDVVIGWHKGTAPWGEPDEIPGLLPDEQEDRTHTLDPGLPSTVDRTLFGAALRFRDAAGAHWLLRPGGQLTEEQPSGNGASGPASSAERPALGTKHDPGHRRSWPSLRGDLAHLAGHHVCVVRQPRPGRHSVRLVPAAHSAGPGAVGSADLPDGSAGSSDRASGLPGNRRLRLVVRVCAVIPAGLEDHVTSHDVRHAFGAELTEAASTS